MAHLKLPWIQIPVKDLHRASLFYRNVFDYHFTYDDLNNIPHAIFKEDGDGAAPVKGALVEVEEHHNLGLGPILFFDCTDKFDEVLAAIPKHGGEVVREKTQIMEQVGNTRIPASETFIEDAPGFFAHFLDSEGNRMGLYGSR